MECGQLLEKSVGKSVDAYSVSMRMFPNPIKDNAILMIALNKSMYCQLQIIGLSGQQIKQFYLGIINQGKNLIKFSKDALALENGAYIVRLKNEELISYDKLIFIE
jgi:hypothetical protein